MPNAYDFGAGHVLLTSGMMSFCRTDGELAFVLSHEVAHGALRHVPLELERRFDQASLYALLQAVSEAGTPALPSDLIVAFQFRGLGKALGKALGKLFKRGTPHVDPPLRAPVPRVPPSRGAPEANARAPHAIPHRAGPERPDRR